MQRKGPSEGYNLGGAGFCTKQSSLCRFLYDTLIIACASGPSEGYNLGGSSVAIAVQLLQELKDAGHEPGAFTHAALMNVFAKAAMCALPCLAECQNPQSLVSDRIPSL